MPRKKSRPRSPFVVTLTLIAAACGGETAKDGAGGGGGGGGGIVNPPPVGCPATMPQNGTACAGLPTNCSYGDECCSYGSAYCNGSSWEVSSVSCNPPAPLPCPETPPVAGSSCGPTTKCGPSYDYCTYGVCGDAPAVAAYCSGDVWLITETSCPLPACDTLDACGCFAREDCQALSDGCICQCDYQCTGEPPCDCICGGGTYLGCKPLDG